MTSNLKSPHSPTSQDDLSANLSQLDISGSNGHGTGAGSAAATTADAELERFRREWENEVKAKKGVASGPLVSNPGVEVGRVKWKLAESSGSNGSQPSVDKAAGDAISGGGPALSSHPAPRSPTQTSNRVNHAGSTSTKREKSPVHTKRSSHHPSSTSATSSKHTMPSKDLDLEELAAKHVIVSGPSTIKGKGSGMIAPDKEKNKLDAVAIYARAVEAEQSGKLNEALVLYRKSFKMDDNVDKLYARSVVKVTQAAAAAAPAEATPSSTDIVSPHTAADEPYTFQRHIQLQPDYEKQVPGLQPTKASPSSAWSRPSALTALLEALPIPAEQTQFMPDEEKLPIPIAQLPPELLEVVLGFLDVASIERFAMTCWRARYLTAKAGVWRRFVQGIWRGPGMLPECQGRLDTTADASDSDSSAETVDQHHAEAQLEQKQSVPVETTRERELRRIRELVARHKGEWRTTLIEEERIRMDGCYISVCHYVRPGAGDQWVTITHLITYHRFLRFYPDGTVISYLTTDHPSEVVPVLRPSLRDKGLHFGRWRLIRSDTVQADEHKTVDDTIGAAEGAAVNGDRNGTVKQPTNGHKTKGKSKPLARIIVSDLLEPGLDSPKYEFEMELGLRETARGKWNKLDLMHYNSINLLTGETLELSLKNQKPFYFSKVKSYHPQL